MFSNSPITDILGLNIEINAYCSKFWAICSIKCSLGLVTNIMFCTLLGGSPLSDKGNIFSTSCSCWKKKNAEKNMSHFFLTPRHTINWRFLLNLKMRSQWLNDIVCILVGEFVYIANSLLFIPQKGRNMGVNANS